MDHLTKAKGRVRWADIQEDLQESMAAGGIESLDGPASETAAAVSTGLDLIGPPGVGHEGWFPRDMQVDAAAGAGDAAVDADDADRKARLAVMRWVHE